MGMSLSTKLIQTLLLSEICLFTFIIAPIPFKYKEKLFSIKTPKPVLISMKGLYIMISIVFIDSLFKRYVFNYSIDDINDIILKKVTEKNLYLTGITLFLRLIYKRLKDSMYKLSIENKNIKVLKKQINNQKVFVEELLKYFKNREEEVEKLKKIIDEYKDEIKRAEILKKQVKNNQDKYFELLDKYREIESGKESKKQ